MASIYQDTRSTTGSNLRNILLQTNKSSIYDLVPSDARQIAYHPIKITDEWRVSLITEIIEAKHKQLEILNITDEDLEAILKVLCVS